MGPKRTGDADALEAQARDKARQAQALRLEEQARDLREKGDGTCGQARSPVRRSRARAEGAPRGGVAQYHKFNGAWKRADKAGVQVKLRVEVLGDAHAAPYSFTLETKDGLLADPTMTGLYHSLKPADRARLEDYLEEEAQVFEALPEEEKETARFLRQARARGLVLVPAGDADRA